MRREVEIVCSVCGYRFNPSEEKACQACPLSATCEFICCPKCGYQNVDPQRTRLGRLLSKVFSRPGVDEAWGNSSGGSGNHVF